MNASRLLLLIAPLAAASLVLAACQDNDPLDNPAPGADATLSSAPGVGDANNGAADPSVPSSDDAEGTGTATTEGSDDPSGMDWRRVEIEGISFEVPGDWDELPDGTWAHPTRGIALAHHVGDAGNPDSLLPEDALVIDEQPLDVDWGEGGRLVTVEVQTGGVGLRYERHAMVEIDGQLHDWALTVADEPHLDEFEPVQQHILDSVEEGGGLDSPGTIPDDGRSR